MKSNRSTDTEPELRLRKTLWALGVRGYRKNVRDLPGRPDLVFRAKRVVFFVDGCYWHRCPRCRKDAPLKTNKEFWQAKLEATVERDRRNDDLLSELDFTVVRLWECDLRADLHACVRRVQAALGKQAHN